MRDWLVAADDRTGALETAAELAAVIGPVLVTVDDAPPGAGVVDLGTRGDSRDRAVARASSVPAARWNAHKIDSTLRGHWADELRARQRTSGRRVLVVPAWPAMGRTCVGGVVHVHGAPLSPVLDQLPEAALLADPAAVERWLLSSDAFGVCDVADTAQLAGVASAVRAADVLVAGPAGAIGAAFGAHAGLDAATSTIVCELPALVVCGSAAPESRRQVEVVRARGADIDVLVAPEVVGTLQRIVAIRLARLAAERMREREYATVVILGGDTAASVLGDAPRLVGGVAAPGMPWSRTADGGGPLVVTKAGAFGDPDALVRLFERETG